MIERLRIATHSLARRVGPRGALMLGVALAFLVALAAATALPPESNVASQPANASTGDVRWLFVFAVTQVAAFAVWGVAMLVVRSRPPALSRVLVLAVIIQCLPLAAPLMLSSDAWGYWGFARVATEHGGNPYVDRVEDFPEDAAYAWMNEPARAVTSPYGPAFTLPSESVARAVGEDATAAGLIYKVMAASGMIMLTLLVARFASLGAFAAAFIGWNPIFAMQFAGAGHNEVLMVVALVAAVGLARLRYRFAAGAAWALATMLKWTALVVLPLQVLEDRAKGRRSLLPGLVVAGGAIALISTLRYGEAWVTHPLSVTGDAVTYLSLSVWGHLPDAIPVNVRLFAPIGAFLVIYVLLMRQAWKGKARLALASVLFLAASPQLWPWYVITPAALAVVEDDDLALWLTVGLLAYTGLLWLGAAGSVFKLFSAIQPGV